MQSNLTTKRKIMKAIVIHVIRCFTLVLFLFIVSCSKDDETEPTKSIFDEALRSTTGINEEELNPYSGSVGLVLNAREIAKLGYKPATAFITVATIEGDYSQTINFDPYTFLAKLSIELEGLSDAAKKEFEAIKVTSDIKDADGNTIMVDPETTVSFQSNPSMKTIVPPVELKNLNSEINLSKNSTYYIQALTDTNNPDSSAMKDLGGDHWNKAVFASSNGLTFLGNDPEFAVQFVPIPNEPNTFAIKFKNSGKFIYAKSGTQSKKDAPNKGTYEHKYPTLSTRGFASILNLPSNLANLFKFRIVKVGNEVYKIENLAYGFIRELKGVGLTFSDHVYNRSTKKDIPSAAKNWRILPANIDWEINSIGTSFETPILPQAKTSFGYNSLLSNCGDGELSGTVGVSETKSTTMTVGWEESMSVTTTNAVNISATIGVEFEAKFFNTGGKYNASITAGYSWERSVTSTSSKWNEEVETVETTGFAERTIIVPPGSASLVYDVFQIYPNTKVDYAQRFRVKARDKLTGLSMPGVEIKTNFLFTGFNGVITEIGEDYIEVSLKGTAIFDQIFKAESTVTKQDPKCEN
ncbi:hypothetical protein MHTCC0001_17000 [Flavobacteriaceae bacterium MHTCC 0001]